MEHTQKELDYLKKKNKTADIVPEVHSEYGMKKHEEALQKMKKMGYDCELNGSILMIYTDEEVSKPPFYYVYPQETLNKKNSSMFQDSKNSKLKNNSEFLQEEPVKKKKKQAEEELPEILLTPEEERYNKIKTDLESTGYDCSWGIRKKRAEQKENLTSRYRNSQ